MGEYLPVVDYPSSASLPQVAVPLVQPNSCGVFPNGEPGVSSSCGVFTPPPIAITSVITQCLVPGCNQVVEQSLPPITIIGSGFGNLPNGLPYAGNSNYLEITNNTKNWTAGYNSDPCTVAIDDWEGSRISLVANVNQNGACPLDAGDQLTVQVWNPQTMAGPATYTLTVADN